VRIGAFSKTITFTFSVMLWESVRKGVYQNSSQCQHTQCSWYF